MTDHPQLDLLRRVEERATSTPWRADGADVVTDHHADGVIAAAFGVYDIAAHANAEAIATGRNLLSAMIELLEVVLADGEASGRIRQAADKVLAQIGDDNG